MSMKWRGVLSAGVVVVLVGCEVVPEIVASPEPGDRPECPHDYNVRTATADAVRAFSGAHANIPEFHDCQQLIEEVDGELRYGALLSVHARSFAFGQREDSAIPADVRAETVTLVTRPDSTDRRSYLPLGISDSLDTGCVAVFGPIAYLLKLGWGDFCITAYDVRELIAAGATELQVIYRQTPERSGPSVARWGFDRASKLQYISTVCPEGPCYVGPKGAFTPDPDFESPLGSEPPITGPWGADDWQYLAELHDLGNGIAELRPSENIGRVAPHEDMEHTDTTDYHGKWVRTALVSIEPGIGSYNRKFGFVASDSGENTSTISICYSDSTGTCRPSWWQTFKRHECGLKEDYDPDEIQQEWYARIESPGARTRYFCVHYRKHAGVTVADSLPPLARWRWLPEDETVWVRCPYGCCEVAVITKRPQ